jgi:hypothetical protein
LKRHIWLSGDFPPITTGIFQRINPRNLALALALFTVHLALTLQNGENESKLGWEFNVQGNIKQWQKHNNKGLSHPNLPPNCKIPHVYRRVVRCETIFSMRN